MADEREVTRDDMEAAAERIAERDGVTVEEVRERVRRVDAAERSRRAELGLERSAANATAERSQTGDVAERSSANANAERPCSLERCNQTFVPKNARHEYCTTAHRAAAYRERERERERSTP